MQQTNPIDSYTPPTQFLDLCTHSYFQYPVIDGVNPVVRVFPLHLAPNRLSHPQYLLHRARELLSNRARPHGTSNAVHILQGYVARVLD